ncbi:MULTISPECIES: Arc family DNA-binding protein [Bradyrhizobium]|uniref:Arc family DNA-binding protein n=1 Tax=Bradyrhizobium TaxID=374 RepID=UPI00155EBFF5|nr:MULTISPECIES: Arc family DNA-binding protein [Bradyrhizobium]MDD1522616.1 hypothetical protein [Bradyrhizobium sp. WBAH30]MDD1546178.1 hypothetical protein [Bradyrhizobium sp. WBAH41]MDD1560058.1 hypothetical protein [Bradyrhizobium sp. WBAH23]MDD1567160.1 hypothetical protein [Bradyrhizobium sp. WBAH33]MDD1593468.1 hypothetical protein [Bradyrhizobium sp. WBAH42]
MNKAQNIMVMTVKTPRDVREALENRATDNVSSMNAEFVRSVRERAEKAVAR